MTNQYNRPVKALSADYLMSNWDLPHENVSTLEASNTYPNLSCEMSIPYETDRSLKTAEYRRIKGRANRFEHTNITATNNRIRTN